MAKKVLVIEDDSFLGDVLVRKLSHEGFEAALAEDGVRGMEEMRTFKPDLVLLDLVLPKMNGYEVLEKKQEDSQIADIPVIIISNSGQPVEIDRALSFGVKDYLVKAEFDPDEVLDKVRKQFGNGKDSGSRQAKKSAKGAKVVIVEDDTLLSDLLVRKLTDAGFNAYHAIDGSEALTVIRKEEPDIILLDILLPGIDGFEILRTLKNDVSLKHIPVLLLSNMGQDKDIKKGEELGAASFLVKAMTTLDEIVEEIERILEKTKQESRHA
jgi:DNA-binding response OmpR family regulator